MLLDLSETSGFRSFLESDFLDGNHLLDVVEPRVSRPEVKSSSDGKVVYWSRLSFVGLKMVESLLVYVISVPLPEVEFRDICRCAGRREGNLNGTLRASSASNLLMRERRLRDVPWGSRTDELWIFEFWANVSPVPLEYGWLVAV
jgi:hypothetical protein